MSNNKKSPETVGTVEGAQSKGDTAKINSVRIRKKGGAQ
jgi:hypothetical protein